MRSSLKVLPYKGYVLVSDLGEVQPHAGRITVVQGDPRDSFRYGRVERDNSPLDLRSGTLVMYRGLSGHKLNEAQRLLRWEELISILEV